MRRFLIGILFVLAVALGVSVWPEAEVHARLPAPERTQMYMGTVQGVEASRLMVRTSEGPTVAVTLTADTRVQIGERAGTLADLKAGQPVTVVCGMQDNRPVARTVAVDVR